jgi:sugar/nucleoside kinase (ribokinase family)
MNTNNNSNDNNITTNYDVVCLGNPLMDMTIEVDDAFLDKAQLKKGTMTLIDDSKHSELLHAIKDKKTFRSTGGSASNTANGVSVLGGKSAFIGMIGKDAIGTQYKKLLEEAKVLPLVATYSGTDKETGLSMVFITPDKERTMATYLGTALEFSEENITEEIEDIIKNSKILHIEGYFIELEKNFKAVLKAMKIAKDNNVKISMDLSDPGLIQRKNVLLNEIMKDYIDIVFVNENEARAFTGFEELDAAHALSKFCEVSVVKLGSKGSIIKHVDKKNKKESIHNILVRKVEVVNTNGAGDSYASGILYSIAKGISFEKAGKIASYISSRVVSIPEATLGSNISLKDEVKRIIDE